MQYLISEEFYVYVKAFINNGYIYNLYFLVVNIQILKKRYQV